MSVLRFLISLAIFLTLWATPLLAQTLRGDAVPAAEGSTSNFAIGYSYVNMNLSGEPKVNVNGVDASAVINFLPRWGATLDTSYARAGRDPGSGHSSYILSVLTGPVFAAAQNENTRLLVRALAGVSLVDSSVQVNQLYYRGWQSRFSWALGTGMERKLSTPFAVRFDVDYLRTKFVGSAGILQPQNGVRVTASLVLRFAAGREPRHFASREP